MLAHAFIDMPSKNVSDKPLQTTMLMRCKWCMKTPIKAREDGCPVHELEEIGQIVLAEYNPDGVEYFKERSCVTCDRAIMAHWLRKGSQEYWCYENQNQFSYGLTGCVYELNGITAPKEDLLVKQITTTSGELK